MKKIKALTLFLLVLCLSLPSLSLAQGLSQVRFLEKGGQINDHANILSLQTLHQLQTYSQSLLSESDICLWLITVHFLDGVDIHTYTARLFEYWQLPENAFLVVLSAGEDAFASKAGEDVLSLLPKETQQRLFSAYLEKPFINLEYDLAISNYIGGLSAYLKKQLSLNLPAVRYQAPAPTPFPTSGASLLWPQEDLKTAPTEEERPSSSQPSKMSRGQVFFLVILLILIFGNRRQKQIAASAGCLGCGCGPLGWLVAILGLSKFFNNAAEEDDDMIYS